MSYVIGITGSMGMGKTTVSHMFLRLGVPVYHADEGVRRAYVQSKPLKKAFEKKYPSFIQDGIIDQGALSHAVCTDPFLLPWLMEEIHPLILKEMLSFITHHQDDPLIALDVPLLFECGYQDFCQGVLVVHCHEALQKKRVLERPMMTEEKFSCLIKAQWPSYQKEALATWVLPTNGTPLQTFGILRTILETPPLKEAFDDHRRARSAREKKRHCLDYA